MKQQNLFTCQDIAHEGEVIQGFCLNLGCQDLRSQFCLQCGFDPKKHTNCKKDLKGFCQIQSFITKFNQYILDLNIQLNKSYSSIKTKYEEFTKYLDNMKIQLLKISEDLNQQDYKQIKDNLQMLKEWYQYSNNQEEIMKQNQIGTQLLSIKRMIETLDQDNKQQQQIKSIYQDNQITLEQGIELLNQQKWEEANEKITQNLKLLEKQSSFATFFQGYHKLCIQLIKNERISQEDQQQLIQRFIGVFRFGTQEKSKKQIYFNCKKLKYSIIFTGYALDDEKKYQIAIEQCEQVLIEEPKHLHALYRKSFDLSNLKENSQAIQCIDIALNYDSKYIVGYNRKGLSLDILGKYNDAIVYYDKAIQLDSNDALTYYNKGISLDNLKKYNDAIVCYDKAIKLDPNFAFTYNNKGISLHNLEKYNDAIVCYDKAIQLDPNFAQAYNNKGISLHNLEKYNDAIVCYENVIQLDPNYAQAYNNKGISLKNLWKYNDAIVFYDKAIQLDPNYALAYNNKGISLKNLGKYNDAIDCYNKAIQLDPNYVQAYKNKGALLSDLKKYQQAIENYEQALLYCKQDQNEFNKLIMELRYKR
ncbi:unnamed protein product [Paramecium pentaurelia]|uniref:Tetratricopeptide repeat protein n=1 Tax=Paramecium pentaurelia TaxID=43138 RepID=A0A8S1U596_9CILI|nr:unnamed protein product [Paramecium pentaurelia]